MPAPLPDTRLADCTAAAGGTGRTSRRAPSPRPPPPVNDTVLATSLSRRLRRQCYLLSKAKHAMTVAVLIRTTEVLPLSSRTRAWQSSAEAVWQHEAGSPPATRQERPVIPPLCPSPSPSQRVMLLGEPC